MKKTLLNLALTIAALALTLASCQRPLDVDGETIYGRQAIDLMAEGQRYQEAGNYRMALDRYGKAIDLSWPRPAPALYYHIGACYYAMREYEKAYETLTTAVRLTGDYPEALYLLGRVRIQLALAAKAGKTPTPRKVASATPTPLTRPTPGKTPGVKTPTPRVRPTPRKTPVRATPAPTKTPREVAVVLPTPRPTPFNPVVVTPKSSVEPAPTPRPTPVISGVPTPPPRATGPLPVVPTEDIFPDPSVTELTDRGASQPTTVNDLLLGEWAFHWEQAQSFYRRDLYEEAVEDLLRVTAMRPRHLEARLMLAECYEELKKYEKAEKEYEWARVLFSNEPKPYFRNGNYYLRRAGGGQSGTTFLRRAIFYYLAALKVDNQYRFAYHNLGIAYLKLGDYSTSRKYFERALQIKSDYGSAHRNLGILYEQHLNDPKKASNYYRQYLRVEPDAPDADEVREWIRALDAL